MELIAFGFYASGFVLLAGKYGTYFLPEVED